MKVGDLVTRKNNKKTEAGLITGFIDKKCWRTDKMGTIVDWQSIEPEPHAVVLFGEHYLTIPLADLVLFGG